MRFSRPTVIAVAVLTTLSLASGAAAAQRQPAPRSEAAPRDITAVSTATQMDAEEMRRALEAVLQQYPPSLPRILKMDPTLLSNDGYLQPYPQLGAFLKQHPDIQHNPSYFFAQYGDNGNFYRETAAGPRRQHVARDHPRLYNWRGSPGGRYRRRLVDQNAGGLSPVVAALEDPDRSAQQSSRPDAVERRSAGVYPNAGGTAVPRVRADSRRLAAVDRRAARPDPLVGAGRRRAHRARHRHRDRLAQHARRSGAAARRDGRGGRSRSASASWSPRSSLTCSPAASAS